MIYCLNCGKGIPDQSKFCTFCGTATARIDPQNPNTASQTTENIVTPVVQPPVNPTPPVQPYVNPAPPQQQYVNPSPQQPQYVNPAPQQPYVNPAPQQPYVNPAPQQQYVNPAYNQQYAPQPHNVVTGKNEFYKNAGFWGAVLVFIGFFLPYVSAVDASFYYLVTDLASYTPELYLYLIFPVSAAVIILQAFTGALPKGLVAFFKILPLLMLVYIGIGISRNESSGTIFGTDIETILGNLGIGFYMTLVGAILMLFFKTTKVKA